MKVPEKCEVSSEYVKQLHKLLQTVEDGELIIGKKIKITTDDAEEFFSNITEEEKHALVWHYKIYKNVKPRGNRIFLVELDMPYSLQIHWLLKTVMKKTQNTGFTVATQREIDFFFLGEQVNKEVSEIKQHEDALIINKHDPTVYDNLDTVESYRKGEQDRKKDIRQILINIPDETYTFPADGNGVGAEVALSMGKKYVSGDKSEVLVAIAKEKGIKTEKEDWKQTIDRSIGTIVVSHAVEFCDGIVDYLLKSNKPFVVFETTLGYKGFGSLVQYANNGLVAGKNVVWRGIRFKYSAVAKYVKPFQTNFYKFYRPNVGYLVPNSAAAKHLECVKELTGPLLTWSHNPSTREILRSLGHKVEPFEGGIMVSVGRVEDGVDMPIFDFRIGEWIQSAQVLELHKINPVQRNSLVFFPEEVTPHPVKFTHTLYAGERMGIIVDRDQELTYSTRKGIGKIKIEVFDVTQVGKIPIVHLGDKRVRRKSGSFVSTKRKNKKKKRKP